MKAILFTDSVNTCDCCGRTDLKGTYLVSNESDEFYYGSTCVKRNLGLSQSDLTNQVNTDKKIRQENARIEYCNSEIHITYEAARNQDYEYGDDYYINTIKPLAKLDAQLRQDTNKKYNVIIF